MMPETSTISSFRPTRNIQRNITYREISSSPENSKAGSVEPPDFGDVFIRSKVPSVKIEENDDVTMPDAASTPEDHYVTRNKKRAQSIAVSPPGKTKRHKPQQPDVSTRENESPPPFIKDEPESSHPNLLSSFRQAPNYYILKESASGLTRMTGMRHSTIDGTPVFVFNEKEGTFLQAVEPTTKYYYRTSPDPYSKTAHCPLWQDYTEQTQVVKALADPQNPHHYNPDYELLAVKMTPSTRASYDVPFYKRFYRTKGLKIGEAIAKNEECAKRYVLADIDMTNGNAVKNHHSVQDIDSKITELSTGLQEMIYATKPLTGDGFTPLGAYRGVPNPFDSKNEEYDQTIEAHLQDLYGPFYRSFSREVDWIDPETEKKYQFKISAAGSSGLMHKINVPLKTNVLSEMDYNLKEVNAPVSNYYAVFRNRKKKADIVVMPLALKHIMPGMTVPKDQEILTDYGEDFLLEILLPEIKEAAKRRMDTLKQESSHNSRADITNPFKLAFRPGKRIAATKASRQFNESESCSSSTHPLTRDKPRTGSPGLGDDDEFIEAHADHEDSDLHSTESDDNDYSDWQKEESDEGDIGPEDSSSERDYSKHRIPYSTRRFLPKELQNLIAAYPSLTPQWLNAEDMPTAVQAVKIAIKHTDWSQGDIAKELAKKGYPIDPGNLGKWGISHGEKSLALWQEAKELKKQYPNVTPLWDRTKNRRTANEAVKLALAHSDWPNIRISQELKQNGYFAHSGTLGRWGIETAEPTIELGEEAAALKEQYPVLTEEWVKSPFRAEANTAAKLVIENPSIKQHEIIQALTQKGLREVSQSALSSWGINKLKEYLAGATEEKMNQLQEQLPTLTPVWRNAKDKKVSIRAAEIAIAEPKLRQGEILKMLLDEGFTLSKTALHDWGIRVIQTQETISPEDLQRYRLSIPELTVGWQNAKNKHAAMATAQYIIDHPYASPQPRIITDLAKQGHTVSTSSLQYWGIIAALKRNIETKQNELTAKIPGLTHSWINAHDKEAAFAAAEFSITKPYVYMSQRDMAKELKKRGYDKISQAQLSTWGIQSPAN